MAQITLATQATPATPSAGTAALYPKSDGKFYGVNDAGTETQLSGIALGTPQASTSGTAIDFTSVPAGTKRITIIFSGVSTNGSSNILVQIGDSGGIETTGYLSGAATDTASRVTSTIGYLATSGNGSAVIYNGSMTLNLVDSGTNTWVADVQLTDSASGFTVFGGGNKSTSAVLDRLRITTVNGTDAFDAGKINIQVE